MNIDKKELDKAFGSIILSQMEATPPGQITGQLILLEALGHSESALTLALNADNEKEKRWHLQKAIDIDNNPEARCQLADLILSSKYSRTKEGTSMVHDLFYHAALQNNIYAMGAMAEFCAKQNYMVESTFWAVKEDMALAPNDKAGIFSDISAKRIKDAVDTWGASRDKNGPAFERNVFTPVEHEISFYFLKWLQNDNQLPASRIQRMEELMSAGNAFAGYVLTYIYAVKEDEEHLLNVSKKLLDIRDIGTMRRYAEFLFTKDYQKDGDGVLIPVANMSKSLPLFHFAAKREDVIAMFYYGQIQACSSNSELCAAWMQKSKNRGMGDARVYLEKALNSTKIL